MDPQHGEGQEQLQEHLFDDNYFGKLLVEQSIDWMLKGQVVNIQQWDLIDEGEKGNGKNGFKEEIGNAQHEYEGQGQDT